MSPSAPPKPTTGSAQPSFKVRYKLAGMIAAVAFMWIDFAVIYSGLAAANAGMVSGGMVLMLGAVALAYYFA